MKKKLGIGAGVAFSALVVVWLLGAGDIIDLPQWANIPGVDVPLVGDTDQIDCKLSKTDIEGLRGEPPITEADLIAHGEHPIDIKIVDGDPDTYVKYVHIWNNGNLLEDDRITRLANDLIMVRPNNTEREQFFSISTTPFREGRVFCESIILE